MVNCKIKAIIFDWGDTLMRDYKEYSGAMVNWPHVEIISGVKEALGELNGKYICCVASNAGDSNVELMGKALERVDIRKYFKYLFTSNELGYSKPSLEFFNGITSGLNIEANNCIMVGNDYLKDIAPAKQVGMRTILLSDEMNEFLMTYADVVITSMKELSSAVEELN
jgi:FMN phosphatase YigB (HAD superfamily)